MIFGSAGVFARVTLTLALSHEGRGDPLAALGAWFRLAVLVGFWIPAFAGMTGGRAGNGGIAGGNDR